MAFASRELEDYWNEFQTIETDQHSDEDELSRIPDDDDSDSDWLDAAGFNQVVRKFQDGRDLSDDELDTLMDTLTQTQAEAVRKRVTSLNTTMRKKTRIIKPHVRDIFTSPDESHQSHPGDSSSQTGQQPQTIVMRPASKSGEQLSPGFRNKRGYSMSGVNSETAEDLEAGITTLGIRPRAVSSASTNRFSKLTSVSDIEVTLDFHLDDSDSKTTTHHGSVLRDPHNVDLPALAPKPDPLGVTLVGDLADCDMERIKALSHIELTSLFDTYSINYSRQKRKKKAKETGIFGVPLDLLIEQDQRRTPGVKVPLVFQAMINFLEKEGLKAEGILRMSGSEIRVKQLRQDLEEKFYQGLFSWGEAGPHDVAVVLKQFLRELPVPLLSYNYLDAFPQISNIPKTLEQLKALNLLILLLPEEHRNTLKVLLSFLRNIVAHSNQNKMGLNNVAMIMAPNLFRAPSRTSRDRTDLDVELKKATGTSKIVQRLVHYQDVLWTIPSGFIAQLRFQYAREMHRKNRISRLPWRKDKDRSDVYRKLQISPEQPEHQDGVIRVFAPHLTKSSTLIQLDHTTTAADVVAKFKLEDDQSKNSDKLKENTKTIGRVEETNGHTFRNPNNAKYAHESEYLYEVGGNITERCLDPQTKVLNLYHVNPLADWVIKKREGRPQWHFHSAHY